MNKKNDIDVIDAPGGSSIRRLVKPNGFDESLIKEVDSLCGELSNCPKLRRQSGHDIESDEDILF